MPILHENKGEPTKHLVVFYCQLFDFERNCGVKVHKEYGIVEVHHCKMYLNYDPFIHATNAIQVYYMPYPEN